MIKEDLKSALLRIDKLEKDLKKERQDSLKKDTIIRKLIRKVDKLENKVILLEGKLSRVNEQKK